MVIPAVYKIASFETWQYQIWTKYPWYMGGVQENRPLKKQATKYYYKAMRPYPTKRSISMRGMRGIDV